MKQQDFEDLKLRAIGVRDEVLESANTANRVGQLLYDMINAFASDDLWEIVKTKEDGTPLEEKDYFIRPKNVNNIVAKGDIAAFVEGAKGLGLPVATYESFGLFKAKLGGGLLYSETEGWYIDPKFSGGGGTATNVFWGKTDNKESVELTISPVTHKLALATHTHKDYLTWKSTMKEYVPSETYEPISKTDTILSAFAKLEAHFGDYVDRISDQTINGTKTFQQNILCEKDVVAFSKGVKGLGLPVASTDQYGLVRYDGSTIKMDSNGRLYVANGGGVDFTVGTGLKMSAEKVLSVQLAPLNIKRRGITLPYYGTLEMTIEIPTSIGDITNLKQGENTKEYFLAGNGNFYKLSDGFVTLDTKQTITGAKWFSAKTTIGPTSNVHIVLGEGAGNVINGVNGSEIVSNLYFNYISGNQFTKIDGSNNILTSGDVIAYNQGTKGLGLPVASSEQYGLVRVDNSSIKMDSSGHLYVVDDTSGFTLDNTYFSKDILWTATGGQGITIKRNSNSTATSISGNIIQGRSGNLETVGNLYFNYVSGSVNVKIGNNGKIYSNGNVVTSDMRLKDKLADVTGVLDSLSYIKAFIYTFKDDDNRIMKIGLSAQDVKKVFPQAVTLNYQDDKTEAYYGIDYAQVLTAVAVNGTKELYQLVKNQNEVIKYLRTETTRKIDTLAERVSVLEKGVAV